MYAQYFQRYNIRNYFLPIPSEDPVDVHASTFQASRDTTPCKMPVQCPETLPLKNRHELKLSWHLTPTESVHPMWSDHFWNPSGRDSEECFFLNSIEASCRPYVPWFCRLHFSNRDEVSECRNSKRDFRHLDLRHFCPRLPALDSGTKIDFRQCRSVGMPSSGNRCELYKCYILFLLILLNGGEWDLAGSRIHFLMPTISIGLRSCRRSCSVSLTSSGAYILPEAIWVD